MGSWISDTLKFVDQNLNDRTKPWAPVLEFLEEKTKLKRLSIFLGILGIVSVYLVFGYAAQLLCNALATCYPAYASLKAIESPQTGDDKKWLTYWTVYAIFSLIDYPCDLLLHWFPFYWLAKCIFMTWLFLPSQYNGATILYNRVIRPKFLQHEGEVDSLFSKVAGSVARKMMDKED